MLYEANAANRGLAAPRIYQTPAYAAYRPCQVKEHLPVCLLALIPQEVISHE